MAKNPSLPTSPSHTTKNKAITMLRTKQWNSSLHNISKKRQAEMASGAWKPKPKTTIRKISKKASSLWAKARRECLETYSCCFLCGATGTMHIHHWQYTRQQRPDLKYDQSNLVALCPRCHNHQGADARFYELKKLIEQKKGE